MELSITGRERFFFTVTLMKKIKLVVEKKHEFSTETIQLY